MEAPQKVPINEKLIKIMNIKLSVNWEGPLREETSRHYGFSIFI